MARGSNRSAAGVTGFALALLLVTACAGWLTRPSFHVVPATAVTAPGRDVLFCGASEAPPFTWTVPSAAGTYVASGNGCIKVTASANLGSYDITALAGSRVASAVLRITATGQ